MGRSRRTLWDVQGSDGRDVNNSLTDGHLRAHHVKVVYNTIQGGFGFILADDMSDFIFFGAVV